MSPLVMVLATSLFEASLIVIKSFDIISKFSLDNILFIINEKTSTLTAQQIPAAPNGTTFPLIANVSIIPPEAGSNNVFAAAEILISEPSEKFPDPLIYVSNRNLGPDFDPRGDTIAIFEFKNSSSPVVTRRQHARQWNVRNVPAPSAVPDCDVEGSVEGSLTLLSQVFTGLGQIRSMTLGPVAQNADEFLVAGANVGGGVAVFSRVDGGRNLTLVARNEEIANRTSFVFV